jgi:hypothetical protein
LTYIAQDANWKQTVEIVPVEPPKSWRLIKKVTQDSTAIAAEEFVFTVRGIISGKELPPITEKPW